MACCCWWSCPRPCAVHGRTGLDTRFPHALSGRHLVLPCLALSKMGCRRELKLRRRKPSPQKPPCRRAQSTSTCPLHGCNMEQTKTGKDLAGLGLGLGYAGSVPMLLFLRAADNTIL